MKKTVAVLIFFVVFVISADLSAFSNDEGYKLLYRDHLTQHAAEAYDTFYKNCDKMKDGESEIKIYFSENVPVGDIGGILQSAAAAFSLDHPECFWISYERLSFSYIESNGGATVITAKKSSDAEYYFPKAYTSPNEVQADAAIIEKSVNELIEQAEAYPSAYEKTKFFHDYLCKNNVYNEYVKNGDVDNADLSAWSPVSAFTSDNDPEKGPVCEGYAKAFKLLCDGAGIPCVIIPGDGISATEGRAAHMWCAVMLDEKWYGVDVTWDDGVTDDGVNVMRHTYFLCGNDTEKFSETHIPDVEEYFMSFLPTPKLSDEGYAYPDASGTVILTVSDVNAVYGDVADVTVSVANADGKPCDGDVSLYKNSLCESNLLGTFLLENGGFTAHLDTAVLSCVNDKRIVAAFKQEQGITCISSAVCNIKPKTTVIDSKDVSVAYSEDIPYLTGEIKSADGEKITYTVKSEVSADKKKMTVYYTDITVLDMNYTANDALTLEFDLETAFDKINAAYIYFGIGALLVIFCLILSLSKRK